VKRPIPRSAPRAPVSRATARKALKASVRAEARYVRDLQSIARRIHEGVSELARPHLATLAGDRKDADGPDLGDSFLARLFKYTRKQAGVAYDRMAAQVNKQNARGVTLLGITPVAAGVGGILEQAREANIALVVNAGRVYAGDVRNIFSDPANVGLRVEVLQAKLVERGNVSESRAALIARDQTLKLNAALTKHRQTAAGVDQYRWSTSKDERVRPGHAELEGELFDWSDPPDTGDGELNHPGEDYQCRCLAIPYIEELDAPEALEAEEPELEQPMAAE
jgi:SPP1 gp7 family putative phage head morphogenesis protein